MVKYTKAVRRLPTNCLSVFDHFVGWALIELITLIFKTGLQSYLKLSNSHFDTKQYHPLSSKDRILEVFIRAKELSQVEIKAATF